MFTSRSYGTVLETTWKCLFCLLLREMQLWFSTRMEKNFCFWSSLQAWEMLHFFYLDPKCEVGRESVEQNLTIYCLKYLQQKKSTEMGRMWALSTKPRKLVMDNRALDLIWAPILFCWKPNLYFFPSLKWLNPHHQVWGRGSFQCLLLSMFLLCTRYLNIHRAIERDDIII